MNKVMDVFERPNAIKWIALSFQHLFAMFGATILVPNITGLSPSIALLGSGIGTLAYLLITKGRIHAYLGSSFAFLIPLKSISAEQGIGSAMFGAFLAGLVYGIIALLIYKFGSEWLNKILPPVVIGSVVVVIGLALSGTAVDMAMNKHLPDGTTVYSQEYIIVALSTLAIAIIASTFFRGFLGVIPILIGIVGGYIVALYVGVVDLTTVHDANWLALPDFTFPKVSWNAAFIMVPIALVTITEHIGHLVVTGTIMDRDLVKNPGLHRSLMGDGIATSIAALIGAPPNTTYGENIGVIAITRVFSVFVIGGAAVLAISFAFIGKIGALIGTIPPPVMGGVSILLFGIIASSGLRMLIDNKVDFNDKRNLVISSVILVIGVGGLIVKIDGFQMEGMALATIVGIVLNLVLPKTKVEGTEEVSVEQEEIKNEKSMKRETVEVGV